MFADAKKIGDTVEGWITRSESRLLYHLAKECTGKGVIVEIGSWKGKSTVFLSLGSKDGKNIRVYAIDPHIGGTEQKDLRPTYDTFLKNIKRVKVDDIVTPILDTSANAAKEWKLPMEYIEKYL